MRSIIYISANCRLPAPYPGSSAKDSMDLGAAAEGAGSLHAEKQEHISRAYTLAGGFDQVSHLYSCWYPFKFSLPAVEFEWS